MKGLINVVISEKSRLITFALAALSGFSVFYIFTDFEVYSPLAFIVAPVFYVMFGYAREKRAQAGIKGSVLCAVLSVLTAAALSLSADVMVQLETAFSSFASIVLFAVSVGGLSALLYNFYMAICIGLLNPDFRTFEEECTVKVFFAVWAVILLAWGVVYLFYFPGISTPDTYTQMHICAGNLPLSNNHPLIHTLLIYLTTAITDFNPWLYSVVQMCIMSAIYAYLCYFMRKRAVPKWFWLLSIAFFAFHPVHAHNAVTVVKDGLFSAFVLLFSIFSYEIVESKGLSLNKKSKLVTYCLSIVAMTLFRSNGILIALISIPVFLIVVKNNRIKLAVSSVTALAVYFSTVYILYPALGVTATVITEALAVPLQQLSCVVVEGKAIPQDISAYLNEIMPLDLIAKNYSPGTVDTIKLNENFNGTVISSDLFRFIQVWFEVLFDYPLTYVKAYLAEVEGIWNPVMKVGVLEPYSAPAYFMNAQMQPVIPVISDLYDKLVNISYLSRYAFFSRPFYIPALYYILMCICVIALKAKKLFSHASVVVPVFALWVSVALSMPRATAGRYVYAAFACIPLVVFAAIRKKAPERNDKK